MRRDISSPYASLRGERRPRLAAALLGGKSYAVGEGQELVPALVVTGTEQGTRRTMTLPPHP